MVPEAPATERIAWEAVAPVSRTGARPAFRRGIARPSRAVRLPILVLFLGAVVTAGLSWISLRQFDDNEQRLLNLRAHEVSSILTTAVPSIQTPLASAAALADATNGNGARFTQFMSLYVHGGRPFTSASLWQVENNTIRLVANVGTRPELAQLPERVGALFGAKSKRSVLAVVNLINQPERRIGYAFAPAVGAGPFVAYAEGALSINRRLRSDSSSAFSDLRYALYFGQSQRGSDLLATDIGRLPATGRRAVVTVPFGDAAFTLVAVPEQALSGTLSQLLPWLIVVVGGLLTIGATWMTLRLLGGRRHAQQLAFELDGAVEDNRRLYAQERTIAESLQQALLPAELPVIAGMEMDVRYLPGVDGVDVGGDWYDVIRRDDSTFLFVVGDVSGRGLQAAAVMASLRFAIRAYAIEGDRPGEILAKLNKLLSIETDGHFATILCALVDANRREITFANAGHLRPLLIEEDVRAYLDTNIGIPIGILDDASYEEVTVSMPEQATLIAFTDGLVERRSESLDAGLERLRSTPVNPTGSLGDLLTDVLDAQQVDGLSDDVALLGIRWDR